MRTRYRWDPDKMKLVPIEKVSPSGVLIVGDLPDFVSPIDGTVVHGRRGLREHMKRHNVTHAQDFEGEWARKAKKRQEDTGKSERVRDIIKALEMRRR